MRMVFQNSSSPLLAYRAGVKLRERCFIQYLVIFSLVCSIITTTPHPGLRLLFPEINCIVDAFSTRSFVLRSVVSSRILRTVISSSKDADDNENRRTSAAQKIYHSSGKGKIKFVGRTTSYLAFFIAGIGCKDATVFDSVCGFCVEFFLSRIA